MGGSSLGPDVLLNTFGKVPGRPPLQVPDTTHPETVAASRVSQPAPLTPPSTTLRSNAPSSSPPFLQSPSTNRYS